MFSDKEVRDNVMRPKCSICYSVNVRHIEMKTQLILRHPESFKSCLTGSNSIIMSAVLFIVYSYSKTIWFNYIWIIIYVICVFLPIVVFISYCNVFFFCLSSSCVLDTICCQCLRIILSWSLLRFSLTSIHGCYLPLLYHCKTLIMCRLSQKDISVFKYIVVV